MFFLYPLLHPLFLYSLHLLPFFWFFTSTSPALIHLPPLFEPSFDQNFHIILSLCFDLQLISAIISIIIIIIIITPQPILPHHIPLLITPLHNNSFYITSLYIIRFITFLFISYDLISLHFILYHFILFYYILYDLLSIFSFQCLTRASNLCLLLTCTKIPNYTDT